MAGRGRLPTARKPQRDGGGILPPSGASRCVAEHMRDRSL